MSDSATLDQFRLSGAWNFRDVGGATTVDGHRVRDGVLYRSSELSRLDDAGAAELDRLGIKDVFDLRGDAERERSGADRVPADVRVHRVPYENHQGEKAPHEAHTDTDEAAQKRYMLKAYASFPALDGAREAITSVVRALENGVGPVLVHCAAGKDRAGWTVATVLRAVGVRESDVVADFLRSNDATGPLRDHVRRVWTPRPGGVSIEPSAALLGVTEEYYRHGLDTVNELYGSFDGYLDALGIDDAAVERLKSALLREPIPRGPVP